MLEGQTADDQPKCGPRTAGSLKPADDAPALPRTHSAEPSRRRFREIGDRTDNFYFRSPSASGTRRKFSLGSCVTMRSRSKRLRATVLEMEVGPPGSAIRSLIPSHRERLWSKAKVANVAETLGR